MNPQQYCDFLMSRMANAKLASGRRFINCRCPICGDSVHPKSAHMYIKIPWDNASTSWYYCHLCNNKGTVSYKTLIEWDIYDQDIADQLTELNKRAINSDKNTKYNDRQVYSVGINHITMDEKTEFKRQYICNRVGLDLSYEDIKNLKMVLNLNDLLYENKILKRTRNENIVNELSTEFIGFLSIDNAFLNMRRTCEAGIVYKSIDKRYINYKIFDKDDTTQRFYTVPTYVNVNTPYRIPFHIAEGPFDILSIYLNLRNRAPGIYTSVSGCNFISVILYFLIDLRLPFIELHIYVDNDVHGSPEAVNKILNRLPDPTIPIYVHRNVYEGQKDFGVPKQFIQESIEKYR